MSLMVAFTASQAALMIELDWLPGRCLQRQSNPKSPARAFLSRGIHVICDKPLTSTVEDAHAFAKAV